MALDALGRMDRLQEINLKIHKSHLTYLQTDDSPSKIQKRLKLEGFIKEYLCLVPNENKYVFPETAHILHRSSASLDDFSGYRACEAWSAISMYASNLLAQPWRKEYRTLRTYSGYYKHEIEANLIGAELMFELMGYKHTGLGTLTLDGPIDPDKVSSVSRDAIVAFVECQILKQIWEAVSKSYKITWLEVLEFRENHVCTPETAIRALTHRFYERLQQTRQKSDIYHTNLLEHQLPSTTMPYHVIGNNYNSPISIKPDYYYPEENYTYFPPYPCFQQIPPRYCRGIHMHSYPNTVYNTRMQTERLIELDTPLTVMNYDKAGGSSQRKYRETDEVDFTKELDYSRRPMKTSTSLDSATNESWDFVLKSLDNIGYSKDLGEREDVLKKREKIKRENKNLSVDDDRLMSKEKKRPTKSHEENFIKKKTSLDLMDLGEHSQDDTTTSSSSRSASVHDKIRKFNNPSIQPKNYQRVVESVKNLTIGTTTSTTIKDNTKKTKDNMGKWDCGTCTYLNTSSREICEMCGKSKRKGNEDKPLASGGKECPKCTLVNEREADECEACGTSLKGSPTYI